MRFTIGSVRELRDNEKRNYMDVGVEKWSECVLQ